MARKSSSSFWPNLNLFGLSDILYNLSIWWKEEVEEEEDEEGQGNRWYAVAITAAVEEKAFSFFAYS